MVTRTVTQAALLSVLVGLFAAHSAMADVVASVDRDRVEQNESFWLELTVDSAADISPELAVLDGDFVIGQTSRLSNTRILNGQMTRNMTWRISLMPKRAGTLAIPPITVGNEQSNPLTVTVTEPRYKPPGEADVFITAEIDDDETFVQAQVNYTIKIYQAVATRQPMLREPTFSGAEVLVEIVGEQRNYEAVLNNRAYSVAERSFAVFPQESGEVQISPARFEARVLRDGRITGRKVFESEPRSITVKPIPAPPTDFPNAAWLPARAVELTDNWSRDPDDLRAGEPISRSISVSALGQLETQIPVIAPPSVAGVNIYPDKPELGRSVEADGIRGIRTDQYAMIGVNAGAITLPALELPWWDVTANEWKVARIPARSVNILPSDEAPPPEPLAAEPSAASEDTLDAPGTLVEQSPFWRRVAEVLAAIWLLTLMAWWWSSRPRREEREPPQVPIHRQQARHLKAARKAALAGDGRDLRQAMLEWGRLQWPDKPPRSIGELAAHVSSPLSEALVELSQISYGQSDDGFDGKAMAKAIRSFAVRDETSAYCSNEPLPPLMPGAS